MGSLEEAPVNRSQTMLCEICIGLGKMTATQEAPVRRQRRGMGGSQYQVPAPVDNSAFFLGVSPPEHEDDMVLLFIQFGYRPVGEGFPPFPLVGRGTTSFDG